MCKENKTTLEQLKSYLWGVVKKCKSKKNPNEYKNYIIILLFIKHLSDVYDEAGINSKIYIPESARWENIRKIEQDIGLTINNALEEIEVCNPLLKGMLTGIDFNNRETMPDERLLDFIEYFSGINLGYEEFESPDILALAYEYLVKQFALKARQVDGKFYTPTEIIRLIINLLEPQSGMSICDPTCGTGGMLVEAKKYVTNKLGSREKISFFGQEVNPIIWTICKINLILHGIYDARIEKGDIIKEPKLLVDDKLMLFDMLISNPPGGINNWVCEYAPNDAYGRFAFGLPPKSHGDYGFLQHMIASLKPTGKMGIIMSSNVFHRSGIYQEIFKNILTADLVEAAIWLPVDRTFDMVTGACLLIINKAKTTDRKGKLLFIDARVGYEGCEYNILRDEDIEKISRAFKKFRDIEKYCIVVDLKEIARRKYSLDMKEYFASRASNWRRDKKKMDEEQELSEAEMDELFDEMYEEEEGGDLSEG